MEQGRDPDRSATRRGEPVPPARRRSGLPGVLAAVLGALSVLTAWVPVLALTTPLTLSAAIVLGFVGLDGRRAARPGALGGLVAGVVALGMTAFYASCLGSARC